MAMNIRLVSADGELGGLCRGILQEFSSQSCHLLEPDDTAVPDLYVWDFDVAQGLPADWDGILARSLFLIHRNDVSRFQESVGWAEANILLKPVTRATLAAFLGLAVSAHEDRLATASHLRADRDEILQCLIQANLKLQEFDQDRTNFLARALHDFRAPLTAIHGYCGLLLNEVSGPLNDEQREVLRRMQHSSLRLSRMASAMFELSIGRHVQTTPRLIEGDLRECMEQALHEVGPLVDSKQISVTVDLHPEAPALCFEPGLMEQVLVNLLDNACKFTPKAGRIGIQGYPYFWERRLSRDGTPLSAERRRRSSSAANAYRVDIFDSGPVIPSEYMENIFEEYTSYSGGDDRSGGGLGLAICRLIIHQHEGRIWAENRDSGPLFSFLLPLRPQQSSLSAESQPYGDLEIAQIL